MSVRVTRDGHVAPLATLGAAAHGAARLGFARGFVSPLGRPNE